ncbi:MAG: hypothetical protein WDN31_19755 [Hyphomicrobium sp.]
MKGSGALAKGKSISLTAALLASIALRPACGGGRRAGVRLRQRARPLRPRTPMRPGIPPRSPKMMTAYVVFTAITRQAHHQGDEDLHLARGLQAAADAARAEGRART